MKFDISMTIGSIIALVALISPIVTAIINNRHQIKVKKLDMYETKKYKSLENFIKSACNYKNSKTVRLL